MLTADEAKRIADGVGLNRPERVINFIEETIKQAASSGLYVVHVYLGNLEKEEKRQITDYLNEQGYNAGFSMNWNPHTLVINWELGYTVHMDK